MLGRCQRCFAGTENPINQPEFAVKIVKNDNGTIIAVVDEFEADIDAFRIAREDEQELKDPRLPILFSSGRGCPLEPNDFDASPGQEAAIRALEDIG